jgi:hypothetical protein
MYLAYTKEITCAVDIDYDDLLSWFFNGIDYSDVIDELQEEDRYDPANLVIEIFRDPWWINSFRDFCDQNDVPEELFDCAAPDDIFKQLQELKVPLIHYFDAHWAEFNTIYGTGEC